MRKMSKGTSTRGLIENASVTLYFVDFQIFECMKKFYIGGKWGWAREGAWES